MPCIGLLFQFCCTGAIQIRTDPYIRNGSPCETPVSDRKKDSADVQFSQPLRKPRKRNGAEFF